MKMDIYFQKSQIDFKTLNSKLSTEILILSNRPCPRVRFAFDGKKDQAKY